MKKTKIIIAFLILALIGCKKENTCNIEVGSKLPEFSIRFMDGTTYSSSDTGWALVVIFNTENKDCQKLLPEIQRIYDEIKDIKIVSIATKKTEISVLNYFAENQLTFRFKIDRIELLTNSLAGNTIPKCILVKDGFVQAIWDDNPLMTFEDIYEFSSFSE